MNPPLVPLAMIVLSLFMAAPGRAADRDRIVRDLATAYGLPQWGSVTRVRFTFNVEREDTRVKRAWTWEPRADRVSVETVADGKPVSTTYLRGDITGGKAPPEAVQADKWFINDSYWLLMPWHLMRDESVKVEDGGEAKPPIGEGTARRVVVTYTPDGGGYTPGDVYVLYLGKDGRIAQWSYHKGGAKEPTMVTTWEDYVQAGPLWIAREHKGADGKFRLWFSDVEVETQRRAER